MKSMIHLLFTQCEDLDIEVRQMKLTCCLNDTLIHLPDLLNDMSFFPDSSSDQEMPATCGKDLHKAELEPLDSPVSSFLDMVVAFSSCNLTHSQADKHVLLKADSFKVNFSRRFILTLLCNTDHW